MKIVILFSGGLDSLIMAQMARVQHPEAEVVKVFYDLGQPYLDKELAALQRLPAAQFGNVRCREIQWLGGLHNPVSKPGSASGDIYIPGRNMVLATAAACQELPDEVWLGALCGEMHAGATDKNETFREMLSATLSYTLSPFKPQGVRVRYPLAEAGFNKLDAVEWALMNGLTVEQVLATSSCLSGEAGNCGECIVCLRRWGIFRQLRRKLGLTNLYERYNTHPMNVPANREIIRQMATSDEHYDEHRAREILPAVGSWLAEQRVNWNQVHSDFVHGFCAGEDQVSPRARGLLQMFARW